jgi:hypothetical protein
MLTPEFSFRMMTVFQSERKYILFANYSKRKLRLNQKFNTYACGMAVEANLKASSLGQEWPFPRMAIE